MGWGYENEAYIYVIKKEKSKNNDIVNFKDYMQFLMKLEIVLSILFKQFNEIMYNKQWESGNEFRIGFFG